MTKDEIERQAKAAGVTPGELLKSEKAAEEAAVVEPAKAVRMQHVFITLADGRRGVFMGPELIKAIEFKLGSIPRPVAVDFEPPREFTVPVPREASAEPREEAKAEEPANADQKIDDKPAA